ncbi:MAG TPA: serine/threonine-protein kinase [Vicinamibacterales bacterium]
MSSSADETSLAETGAGQGATPTGWLSSSSDASHDRLAPGTILSARYRIGGSIGRGGMGEVYRADDLRLGQPVALKFLPAALGDDAQRLAQFHNEVRVARQISHRNVCRVYDIGEADGRIFLSMEYVDGEDLSSLLKRIGRLPQEKGIEIARQICAGLAAAHEQGVLHRDLKPANIMLDGEGRVRITDFGLAGVAGEIKDLRSGTPAYMAPEQLAGREVTFRSDIFSLGLVLYEIFTGRRAFDARTVAELLRMHDEGVSLTPTSAVRDLDPAIERVIQRCLEPDPANRPASAMAVSAGLPGGDPLAAALAAGETPSPEMVAAAGRTDAVPLRHSLPALAACALLIGTLVLVQPWLSFTTVLPLPRPAAVLEDRARTILERFGYTDAPADGFGAFTALHDYAGWVRRTSQAPDRWKHLATGRVPVAGYWYRTSPRPLIPLSDGWRPGTSDPPLDRSGMTLVLLDTTGRLLEFHAVPPQREAAPPAPDDPAAPVDWSTVFELVDWPMDRFTPAAPEWMPRGFADARAAWTGTLPELGDIPLRLEAAAFRGRITYVQTLGPWARPARMEAAPVDRVQRALGVLTGLLILALLTSAVLLARYNLRLGRGDRRTATRVALVLFGTRMVAWTLSAHHVADFDAQNDRFFEVCSQGLLQAAIFWLAYIAIEPWIRRHWPSSLVSWTRLFTRGWRDPLVGRDLLIGIAFGAALALFNATSREIVTFFGMPPDPPPLHLVAAVTGPPVVAADILLRVTNGLQNGVLLALFYVGLRKLLRSRIAAGVALIALLDVFVGAEGALRDGLWQNLVPVTIFSTLFLLPLLRFGLLAFVTTSFAHQVLQTHVFTASFSAWYATPAIMALVTIAGLIVFAFVQSRAGEPLFGVALAED